MPEDANPYYYYDLDWIVTVPNMDPWIRPFETLKENQDEVVVKTGFGAILRKQFACPMPEMTAWEIDDFEKVRRETDVNLSRVNALIFRIQTDTDNKRLSRRESPA